MDTKYRAAKDFQQILKKRSQSQETFAKSCGVSDKVISSVIHGSNVSRQSAERIASTLQKPVSYYFEAVDPDKTLSSNTILHYHRALSSIFSKAAQWGYIQYNLIYNVEAPKIAEVMHKYLTEEELGRLLMLLNDVPVKYRVAVLILVLTGMRRGELCGLKWEDIDSAEKLVRICRALQYIPEAGVFETTPKTESSKRYIKATDDLLTLFVEIQAFQDDQRERAGDMWTETGYVFTRDNGLPMHPDTLTNWFHGFIAKDRPAPYFDPQSAAHIRNPADRQWVLAGRNQLAAGP